MKKDFMKKQMEEDSTSLTTQALLGKKKPAIKSDGDLVKVCLRLPKKQLIKLKKKKLDQEEDGEKSSVQDMIIEAIDEYLNK